MRDQLERIGKRFIGDVQRDDAAGLAAELAYRFLFAVFPFVTIVGASLLTTEVATTLRLAQSLVDAVNLLRWPLVFVLLSGAVAILYHRAPNFRAPWRWCLAGGAIFSAAWILATGLFALYVANFAN